MRADRGIAVPLLSLLRTHHLQYSIYSKCNIGFNGTIPARRQSPINREFRIRKLVGVNNAARVTVRPVHLLAKSRNH